jgi:hypothetical protein
VSQPLDVTPRLPLGTSPANSRHNAGYSQTKRHRSEENMNGAYTPSCEGTQARTAATKIFAATGFDAGNTVLDEIHQLPDAEIAKAVANAAIPDNVTHLITTGQLTVKLLTALVKGCWVLPEEYVRTSVAKGKWEMEQAYGFRHRNPVLKGKTFIFTENFKKTRHYATARLVATEGGADVIPEVSPAQVRDFRDPVVLCTPQEYNAMQALLCSEAETMTWDSMVKTIYPPNVIASSR